MDVGMPSGQSFDLLSESLWRQKRWKGCRDFFFLQLLVQHTIPTTFNSQKYNVNEIILFQNSPVQPLLLMWGVVMVRNLVIGGRLGMLWRAWVGPLRRSASQA